MLPLFAAIETDALVQYLINGLSYGMLIALVALGYTMVYGIVELINFAHGDLFMLGGFLGWTIVAVAFDATAAGSTTSTALALFVCFVVVPCFCGLLNFGVDRVIYKPLRNAPKSLPAGITTRASMRLSWLGSAGSCRWTMSARRCHQHPTCSHALRDASMRRHCCRPPRHRRRRVPRSSS